MYQHGPSWNPAHTLSNEPDNSTGAFSSQEKWYLQKPVVGWNQKLCCSSDNMGDKKKKKKLINRIGIIQSQSEETQPVRLKKGSEYQMVDNDRMGWIGEGEMGVRDDYLSALCVGLPVCLHVCVYLSTI